MQKKIVVTVINDAEQFLAAKGLENPRLDAELLMAFTLRKNRIELYLDSSRVLTDQELTRYWHLVQRRSERVSLEDITDQMRFHQLDLEINPAVFIPHKETEVLVKKGIELIEQMPSSQVVDLGTGNGAIGLNIAFEIPQARVWAIDSSSAAVALAIRNCRKHDLSDRVTILKGNLFEPLPTSLEHSIELIISNPPFRPVEQVRGLAKKFRFELSETALSAGEDGLDYHRLIAKEAPRYLKEGGWVIMEISSEQSALALQILNAGWSERDVLRDQQGLSRAVLARWIG